MTFADPVVVTAMVGGFLGSVFGFPWGIVGLLLGALSGWLMFRRTGGQEGRQ